MYEEKKCGLCGYRINPEVMKDAGDISSDDWISYQTNPIESWCDYYSKMVPDSNQKCSNWISLRTHDAQMVKYGR